MKLAVSVCQPKTSRTSIKGRERREGSIISRGQHVRTPFLCRFPRLLAPHPIRAIPADRVHCTCPNALATASRAQCISSVASSCMQGHVCRRPSFLPSFLPGFLFLVVLSCPCSPIRLSINPSAAAAPFNQFSLSLYPSIYLSSLFPRLPSSSSSPPSFLSGICRLTPTPASSSSPLPFAATTKQTGLCAPFPRWDGGKEGRGSPNLRRRTRRTDAKRRRRGRRSRKQQ